MVELKGFHGTLDEKANKILSDKFIHSKKDTEWLGFGVYFFADKKDAKQWALMEARKKKNHSSLPAVLVADILTEEALFCDLDLQENMSKLKEEFQGILKSIVNKGKVQLTKEQTRCVCCNFFAKKYKIKVLAYTFPSLPINELGFPIANMKLHRQFCVRDDNCINNLRKCHKGEI